MCMRARRADLILGGVVSMAGRPVWCSVSGPASASWGGEAPGPSPGLASSVGPLGIPAQCCAFAGLRVTPPGSGAVRGHKPPRQASCAWSQLSCSCPVGTSPLSLHVGHGHEGAWLPSDLGNSTCPGPGPCSTTSQNVEQRSPVPGWSQPSPQHQSRAGPRTPSFCSGISSNTEQRKLLPQMASTCPEILPVVAALELAQRLEQSLARGGKIQAMGFL